MRAFELIVVGHIMKEIIEFPDKKIGPVLGSPAAYSSVAASVLGTITGIVSVIGKDMPKVLFSPLIDAGVDVSGLNVRHCNTRTTILTYDSIGDKKVIYEAVAPNILFEDIPKQYLDSSAFFVCPMDFEVPLDTVMMLKEKTEALLMTDLGGYGGTVSTFHPAFEHSGHGKLVKDIVAYFDIVKASSEDCRYLFPGSISDQDALETLLRWGAKIAIITLGKDGSIISDGNHTCQIPSLKTNVVDTTGAGDVYCAAFISEFLRTKDIYVSGLHASAAASVLIEKTGGVVISRMPKDSIVRERLKKF
jgi:sugar/nucleoside kinase (ribokinase family)